jgi:hypothetical protein
MEITIYANYGLLGHEKSPVYKQDKIGDINEKVDIVLPDELNPKENEYGEITVELSGARYPLNGMLRAGKDDKPILVWYDGEKPRTMELKEA